MNQSALRPTILKYGLTGGLIFSLIYLIFTISGLANTGSPMSGILNSVVSIGIMIVLIVMAIKQHRDQLQNGFITLGQCVLIGAGLMALAGIISGLVSLVYTNFVDPEYMERLMATMEEAWEAQGLTEDQIEQARGWTAMMKSPYLLFATAIGCYAIGGAILSLIIGLIMKRDQPQFS